jgi:hypothetical protein
VVCEGRGERNEETSKAKLGSGRGFKATRTMARSSDRSVFLEMSTGNGSEAFFESAYIDQTGKEW